MTDLLSRMESQRFQTVVKSCIEANGWTPKILTEGLIRLSLVNSDDGEYDFYFSDCGSVIEIVLGYNELQFNTIEEVPGFLSSHLLISNRASTLSFWTLEQISEKYLYALVFNCEHKNLTPRLLLNVLGDMMQKNKELSTALIGISRSLS